MVSSLVQSGDSKRTITEAKVEWDSYYCCKYAVKNIQTYTILSILKKSLHAVSFLEPCLRKMRPSKQFCFWDTPCKKNFQCYNHSLLFGFWIAVQFCPLTGGKSRWRAQQIELRGLTPSAIRVSGTTALTTPHVRTNYKILFFWNNHSFWFCLAPKNFFEPLIETPLLGGHTSKTFWSDLS